jgi:hypothetical protein
VAERLEQFSVAERLEQAYAAERLEQAYAAERLEQAYVTEWLQQNIHNHEVSRLQSALDRVSFWDFLNCVRKFCHSISYFVSGIFLQYV